MYAPEEIIEVQIDGKLTKKIDSTGETSEPIEFISTGTDTIYDRQIVPHGA